MVKVIKTDPNWVWLASLWKRKLGHRNKHTHWGNIIWWSGQRSGWSIYKPRDARDCHQDERKEKQIPPQSTQKELTSLILGFQPPKLWDNEFLFKTPSLWPFRETNTVVWTAFGPEAPLSLQGSGTTPPFRFSETVILRFITGLSAVIDMWWLFIKKEMNFKTIHYC